MKESLLYLTIKISILVQIITGVLAGTGLFINIDKYANTTAATIPIAIYDALESKKLAKNNNLVITTFGAGFTWGSIYIKWNIDDQ